MLLGLILAIGIAGLAVSTGAGAAPATTNAGLAASGGMDVKPAFTATDSEAALKRELVLEQRPDTPGEFGTEVRFSIPDRVTELEVDLESAATVETTDGFEHVGDNSYEWTGGTDEPTLTFAMPANRTEIDRHHGRSSGALSGVLEHPHLHPHPNGHEHGHGPESELDGTNGDGYYFVETGSWGLVSVPQMGLQWTRIGEQEVPTERTVRVDGPGTTGGDLAYFGDFVEHTRTAYGEQFRLVVPTAASLEESPTEILDSLEDASGSLDIGGRNTVVFIVAAPTGDVAWAANGVQHGTADTWVTDDARLDQPRNVWLHEYVHTRQTFVRSPGDTTPETRWLIEAQAEYEATLLSLEQERIDVEAFQAFLRDGERSPQADTTLADPNTWVDHRTPYTKGPLVFGTLDGALRLETDGERTMRDVLRELNRQDEPITESAFLSAVEDAGGQAVREQAERYTQTAAVPETWSADDHQAAFDHESVSVTYTLTSDVELSGPYRNESHTSEELPPVVPEETLTLTVDVENTDSEAGTYGVTLEADGRAVDRQEGRLEPGARESHPLEWTPTEPGTYQVGVGSETITIEVQSPATATVSGLSADPSRVSPGEPATVRATVTNEHDRPAKKTVAFHTPNGVTDEQTARLGPSESATLETTVSFEDSGRYQVTAGDQETTVTVSPVFDALPMPGFGIPAAVIALTLCLLGLRLRSHSRSP